MCFNTEKLSNNTQYDTKFMNDYPYDACGVCEKKDGEETTWFNPFSRGAHYVCYQKIRPFESKLLKTIHETFHNNGDRNVAHVAAIKAIKQKLGRDVSIETYLETHGAEKLQQLFDTVGVKAAKQY